MVAFDVASLPSSTLSRAASCRRPLVEHLAHLDCKIATAIGLAEERGHLPRFGRGIAHGVMRVS
jgi:hypothetical protein